MNGDHDGHDSVKPEMPTPAPTPSELPASPTRNGVFRIQKPAPNSRQNGRKQSFDPVHFDRIDPNSVNVLNHYSNNGIGARMTLSGINGMANQSSPPLSNMAFVPTLPVTGYPQPGLISYGPPLGYALVPIHSQMHNSSNSMAQGPEVLLRPPPHATTIPPANPAVKSCCAPASALPPQPQYPAQTPQPRVPPKKSCCGGGSSEETQSAPNSASHQRAISNGSTFTQLQPSFMDMKSQQQQHQQPFAVSYPNQTVFTYPANYGTWAQPLNPAMWAQLQQTPQQQTNGAAFQNSVPNTPNGGSANLGTSHECSCGPGCQCVGCLAHPFNPQTLQYVGGAWDYDIDIPYGTNGADKHNSSSPGTVNDNSAPIAHTNGNGTNGHAPNGGQQAVNHDVDSPPQAQTPSDASGFNEELSASDFMFVNLPLYQDAVGMDGDSCGGSLAFCPCGDDCQCVGCVIHNAQPLDGPLDGPLDSGAFEN